MGTGNSKSKPQLPGQTQSGPLNRFKSTVNTGINSPPTQPSKIYDLQFILANPPPIILQPQQNTSNNKRRQTLDAIKAKIIEYNKTWNFGNQSNGQPQSLLEEKNYNNFIVFVTNLIQGRNTPNQSLVTGNANARSYQDKQDIVREIHKLVVSGGGNQLVNEPFKVGMSEIFPNFPGVIPDDTMMVTLLGLASIIGAEHIVIYLLMIGADPSITKTDNRDSATLMLSFQIGIYKLLQQQQPINLKYFIILPRILYILFLLGSIGEGVDLSAIFETNEKKIIENNSKKLEVPVRSSILNMLAQMPGNTSDETARQTLQNGGSIPLLLEILERNNTNPLLKPKFFKVINSLETPYDLNVLYSVLMNPNIDDKTKLKLTELLVLTYKANITNIPTFIEKRTNITIFERIILAIDDIKFTNPQTKLSILEIFSFSNQEFKDRLEKSKLLNNSNSKSNTNKNAIIKRLEAEVALLRQKSKLITNRFAGNIAATGAQAALINAEIASLTGKSPTNFSINHRQSTANSFGTNKGNTQQIQLQSPGLAKQFSSNSLSQVLQPQPIQQPGSRFNKFKFWEKVNNGKPAAQKNSQSNLIQEKTPLPQAASQMSSSTNLPQKPKGVFNRFKNFSLFGKKNNKGLTVAQPALLSSSQPISLQSPILNPTTSSGSLQPLNNPPNLPLSSESLLPVAQTNLKPGQVGGKKIQMRTYHFLKHKKYSERAFIAERPIIAADNAYDFMKLHYDIGSKKITFTIHDRVNNKKYKYTARTLKDGTNVIKSAK